MKTIYIFTATMALGMGLASCLPEAPATPSVALISTSVDATLTALPQAPQATEVPTYTPYPTYTPFPTEVQTLPPIPPIGPTITPTLTNIAPPGSPGGGGNNGVTSDYACILISQTPANGTLFKPRDTFDITWKVQNSGARIWEPAGVDLAYVSGTKFYNYGGVEDIPTMIGIGKSTSFKIDAIAPKTDGTYTMTWGLDTGSKPFCLLSLTIVVH